MKKLLFAILLVLTISVSLIACGGSDNGAEYISLSKTSSHSPSMTVSPGGEIVYSVALTNSEKDAHTVTVNDSVPTGCELVSGDFTLDEGVLSCEGARIMVVMLDGTEYALPYVRDARAAVLRACSLLDNRALM